MWFQNVPVVAFGMNSAETISQAPTTAFTYRPTLKLRRPTNAAVTATIPETQALVRSSGV
jgi:hypothetical protein